MKNEEVEKVLGKAVQFADINIPYGNGNELGGNGNGN